MDELLSRLRKLGIDAAIDACGAVPWERFENLLPFAPVFLYDFKTLDPALHKEFTGRDNAEILDNLEKLCKAGAAVKLRVPVIGGVNEYACERPGEKPEIEKMAEYAERFPVQEIALLPYHNTGSHKWARFGMTEPDNEFYTPAAGRMEELAAIWRAQTGRKVVVGG
jgi:pyruvate formate lyase activating enzyme